MPSKKIRVRFYADECFPVPSVTFLKSLGVSIIHAYDLKLTGESDNFHLKQAKKLTRVLISIDRDFIGYKGAVLSGHPGVVLISGQTTVPSINKICQKQFPKLPHSIKGKLALITDSTLTSSA